MEELLGPNGGKRVLKSTCYDGKYLSSARSPLGGEYHRAKVSDGRGYMEMWTIKQLNEKEACSTLSNDFFVPYIWIYEHIEVSI